MRENCPNGRLPTDVPLLNRRSTGGIAKRRQQRSGATGIRVSVRWRWMDTEIPANLWHNLYAYANGPQSWHAGVPGASGCCERPEATKAAITPARTKKGGGPLEQLLKISVDAMQCRVM